MILIFQLFILFMLFVFCFLIALSIAYYVPLGGFAGTLVILTVIFYLVGIILLQIFYPLLIPNFLRIDFVSNINQSECLNNYKDICSNTQAI